MGYISTVIEKDFLTVIEWRGGIVVNGKSPRVKEFEDFLHNQFKYPVAVEAADAQTTSDFDVEKRAPQSGFDLAAAVINMSTALDLEVIITEEL